MIKLKIDTSGSTMPGWRFWPVGDMQVTPVTEGKPVQVLFVTASSTMADIVVHVPCNRRCGWTREIDGHLVADHSDHTRTLEPRHLPRETVDELVLAMADAWRVSYEERAAVRVDAL